MPNKPTHFLADIVCHSCGRDKTKLGALELPFGLSSDNYDDLLRQKGYQIDSVGRSGLVSVMCPDCIAEETGQRAEHFTTGVHY